MPSIPFSEEWTKLEPGNREVGKIFTTARAYEARKDTYYRSYLTSIDREFEIKLKGFVIGKANLVTIQYKWTAELDEAFWRSDMYPHTTRDHVRSKMKQFYNNENPFLIVLTLRWTEVKQ